MMLCNRISGLGLAVTLLLAVVLGCAPDNDDGASTASLEQTRPADQQAMKEMNPTVPATPLEAPPAGDPSATSAAKASLGIGDAAPPLVIASWIRGEPFDGFEPGQVYVVEFWATWCGPCLAGMPHMSETQEAYGDKVKMVGITDEPQSDVDEFLVKEQSEGVTWQEVIKYRIALDDNNATNRAYRLAAKQNGIPSAFIVGKDGVVEWIGHPMEMDQPLEQIVNDSWDRETAAAAFEAQQRMTDVEMLARSGNFSEALAILDEIEEQAPSPLTRYYKWRLLTMDGRTSEIAAARTKLIDAAWDEIQMLNQVAWATATGEDPSEQDLADALKAAKRASELTNDEEAAILDTLARVYYEQGDLDQAIAWQQKAVDNAGAADKEAVSETLEQYQSEKEGS